MSGLVNLSLFKLSCSEHNDRPVLDLKKHHRLERLELDKLSISGLLLPGQEELQLWELKLWYLTLPHDNINHCHLCLA